MSVKRRDNTSSVSITALFVQWSEGNREVETRLLSEIYAELRRIAARHMRRERASHTLQPTALINEAWMRLVEQPHANWQNRAHFFAVASRIVHEILVDHARRRLAGKRGGANQPITLEEPPVAAQDGLIETLALHEAIGRLREFDPRAARIIELHFFGGLSFEEMALVLDVSARTVKRDWQMARAWLRTELSKAS